jgi:tRNA (cmo5U34)-methyltransferase
MPRPLWRLPLIVLRERGYKPGRLRVPEPMAMDEIESVAEFHEGGTTMGAMLAIYDLNARALDALVPEGGRLLDLGVGSGRAVQRFLAMRPDVFATCVDLAPNMLATARRFLDESGVGERVTLVEGDITALPDRVTSQQWDAISCVWTLHHLPDRDVLRSALRQIAQIHERDGSAVWLLDFHRLRNPHTFSAIVDVLEKDVPPFLRADGLASEAAAFTQKELRSELAAAGLSDLESGLARPITSLQAFWCRGQAGGRAVSRRGRLEPLRGSARMEAMIVRRGFSRLPF